MRKISHVLVMLLSRECFYSANWRSILLVRLYTLGRIVLNDLLNTYIEQYLTDQLLCFITSDVMSRFIQQ